MNLKKVVNAAKQQGIPMQRRLLLYLMSMLIVLFAAILLVLSFTGALSRVDKNTQKILNMHLSATVQNVETHFGNVTAQGINLSDKLGGKIRSYLADNHLSTSDLNNNAAALNALQSALFETLDNGLKMTDASGVFCILNASVNTETDRATKSGIYLKLAHVNVKNPVNSEVGLFRGSKALVTKNNIRFHNRWDLEFHLENTPFISELIEGGSEYEWSPSIALKDTWENVMYLCVPITGPDGQTLGVCGYEMSEIYFKLAHPTVNTEFNHVTSLLGKKTDWQTLSLCGLESGGENGYFANIQEDSLVIEHRPYFQLYRTSDSCFAGVEKDLSLSPGSVWTITTMIPYEDYQELATKNNLFVTLLCLLFLIFAVLASVFISKKYVRPILAGFDKVKSGTEKTRIPEIDDLIDFLASKDEKPAEPAQSRLYQDFVKNIETLSKAERAVFNLYMEGYKATEIADILCLSINTIKTHNKRIYMKLNVSSRKELMVYVNLMKEKSGSQNSMNNELI